MTGFADRFGTLGRGQDHPRQWPCQVLQASTGTADALAVLDLPDPRRRALAQVRGETPAQFATAAAAVRQQPVTWIELVIHSPQALDPLLR